VLLAFEVEEALAPALLVELEVEAEESAPVSAAAAALWAPSDVVAASEDDVLLALAAAGVLDADVAEDLEVEALDVEVLPVVLDESAAAAVATFGLCGGVVVATLAPWISRQPVGRTAIIDGEPAAAKYISMFGRTLTQRFWFMASTCACAVSGPLSTTT
jgi:hypothetical protein